MEKKRKGKKDEKEERKRRKRMMRTKNKSVRLPWCVKGVGGKWSEDNAENKERKSGRKEKLKIPTEEYDNDEERRKWVTGIEN